MAKAVHAPSPDPKTFCAGQSRFTLCLPEGYDLAGVRMALMRTTTVPQKVTCKRCIRKRDQMMAERVRLQSERA